jgi:hypothetical protein
MNHRVAAVVVASAISFAIGCTPVDPDATGYGAAQRVGVAAVTYVPVESGETTQPFSGRLGFAPSQSAEIYYVLGLRQNSDLRISLDFGAWPVKFAAGWIGPDNKATWRVTTLLFQLGHGAKWGRFGAYYRAGTAWQFNELDWTGHTTAANDWFGLQMNLGVSLTVHPSAEVALDLGYRASRSPYERDGSGYAQILEAFLLKLGFAYLF